MAEALAVQVPLSRGFSATIDASDLELVSKHKWQCGALRKGDRIRLRAQTWLYARGKLYTVLMHRLITGAAPGQVVDHIDGNPLNNRRSNLRICTTQQNSFNQRLRIGLKYRGVTKRRRVSRDGYIAQIGWGFKKIHIGVFDNPDDAARAYDAKARELFGEFAALNFPREGERGCR